MGLSAGRLSIIRFPPLLSIHAHISVHPYRELSTNILPTYLVRSILTTRPSPRSHTTLVIVIADSPSCQSSPCSILSRLGRFILRNNNNRLQITKIAFRIQLSSGKSCLVIRTCRNSGAHTLNSVQHDSTVPIRSTTFPSPNHHLRSKKHRFFPMATKHLDLLLCPEICVSIEILLSRERRQASYFHITTCSGTFHGREGFAYDRDLSSTPRPLCSASECRLTDLNFDTES